MSEKGNETLKRHRCPGGHRGEIAVRIIAAARRIGASPVLAASAADADSPAARLADRVIVIGPARSPVIPAP